MNISKVKERKTKKEPLKLEYIGINHWCCPIYRDQHGHFWTDLNQKSKDPDIWSLSGDYMDAPPEHPISVEYVLDDESSDYAYDLKCYELCKMKEKYDLFLKLGNTNIAIFKDPQKCIDTMKELWNSLPEDAHPKWLSWEQILEYEKQMHHCMKE